MRPGKVPIAEGERTAKKYQAPIVLVFTMHDGGNTFNVLSCGVSKLLCRHAASLAAQIADRVLDGSIAPEQIEPLHLPDAPQVWDGEVDREARD